MKMSLDNEIVSSLRGLLAGAKKIVIVMHVNPDGDAMGACLAMYHSLLQLYPEQEIVLVSPNHYPAFLRWMDGSNKVLIFRDKQKIVRKDSRCRFDYLHGF